MNKIISKVLFSRNSKLFLSSTAIRAQETVAKPTTSSDSVIPGFREPGQIPTNWELASGAERHEYIAQLKGEDPWEDMHPVLISKLGTTKNPIIVKGVDVERYIGCTGFPIDSHEPVWLTLRERSKGFDRCCHCGSVYKYVREHEEHHH